MLLKVCIVKFFEKGSGFGKASGGSFTLINVAITAVLLPLTILLQGHLPVATYFNKQYISIYIPWGMEQKDKEVSVIKKKEPNAPILDWPSASAP